MALTAFNECDDSQKNIISDYLQRFLLIYELADIFTFLPSSNGFRLSKVNEALLSDKQQQSLDRLFSVLAEVSSFNSSPIILPNDESELGNTWANPLDASFYNDDSSIGPNLDNERSFDLFQPEGNFHSHQQIDDAAFLDGLDELSEIADDNNLSFLSMGDLSFTEDDVLPVFDKFDVAIINDVMAKNLSIDANYQERVSQEIKDYWLVLPSKVQEMVLEVMALDFDAFAKDISPDLSIGETFNSPIYFDVPTFPITLPQGIDESGNVISGESTKYYDLVEIISLAINPDNNLRQNPMTRGLFNLSEINPAPDAILRIKERVAVSEIKAQLQSALSESLASKKSSSLLFFDEDTSRIEEAFSNALKGCYQFEALKTNLVTFQENYGIKEPLQTLINQVCEAEKPFDVTLTERYEILKNK